MTISTASQSAEPCEPSQSAHVDLVVASEASAAFEAVARNLCCDGACVILALATTIIVSIFGMLIWGVAPRSGGTLIVCSPTNWLRPR